MPKALDLAGKRFGRLIVEGLATGDPIGRRRWRCQCDCGATVMPTTNDLTSGRHEACLACGGPQPERNFPRVCMVCGTAFEGKLKAMVCSNKCRRARRRGVAAGVDWLPPAVDKCEVCGNEFSRDRGLKKCCSAECLLIRKRRRQLESWRRRCEKDPDLPKKMGRSKKERAQTDPIFAEKIREQERRRWSKNRERMKTDPEYAEQHRQRAALHWVRNRERLTLERRTKIDAMGPEELAAWMEQSRRHSRNWRRREMAAMTPEQLIQYQDRQCEYRRQRRRLQLAVEAARIEERAINGPRTVGAENEASKD